MMYDSLLMMNDVQRDKIERFFHLRRFTMSHILALLIFPVKNRAIPCN